MRKLGGELSGSFWWKKTGEAMVILAGIYKE